MIVSLNIQYKVLFSLFAISLLVSFVLTPFIRKLAIRRGLFDYPDSRKIHLSPIPNVGGFAIMASVVLSTVWWAPETPLSGILLGAIVVYVVGLLDDVFNLRPWMKLLGQILAACITIQYGLVIQFVHIPFLGELYFGILAMPITLIWILGIVNAINLIDGVDGLSSGIAFISAMALTLISGLYGAFIPMVLGVSLMGACIGFLRFNYFPAKIFMGDGGSMFLGFCLSSLSILMLNQVQLPASFIVPILILLVPITDICFAVFRRIKSGVHIFLPDQKHIHHTLLKRGLLPSQVTHFLWRLSFGFSLAAVCYVLHFYEGAILISILTIGLSISILGHNAIKTT